MSSRTFTDRERTSMVDFLYDELIRGNPDARVPHGFRIWRKFKKTRNSPRSDESLQSHFKRLCFTMYETNADREKVLHLMKELNFSLTPLQKRCMLTRYGHVYNIEFSGEGRIVRYSLKDPTAQTNGERGEDVEDCSDDGVMMIEEDEESEADEKEKKKGSRTGKKEEEKEDKPKKEWRDLKTHRQPSRVDIFLVNAGMARFNDTADISPGAYKRGEMLVKPERVPPPTHLKEKMAQQEKEERLKRAGKARRRLIADQTVEESDDEPDQKLSAATRARSEKLKKLVEEHKDKERKKNLHSSTNILSPLHKADQEAAKGKQSQPRKEASKMRAKEKDDGETERKKRKLEEEERERIKKENEERRKRFEEEMEREEQEKKKREEERRMIEKRKRETEEKERMRMEQAKEEEEQRKKRELEMAEKELGNEEGKKRAKENLENERMEEERREMEKETMVFRQKYTNEKREQTAKKFPKLPRAFEESFYEHATSEYEYFDCLLIGQKLNIWLCEHGYKMRIDREKWRALLDSITAENEELIFIDCLTEAEYVKRLLAMHTAVVSKRETVYGSFNGRSDTPDTPSLAEWRAFAEGILAMAEEKGQISREFAEELDRDSIAPYFANLDTTKPLNHSSMLNFFIQIREKIRVVRELIGIRRALPDSQADIDGYPGELPWLPLPTPQGAPSTFWGHCAKAG